MDLVIFALPEESREFRRAAAARPESGHVWRGHIGARPVLIAHCGVGPGAAAVSASALLTAHRPARVIATGFAGALSPALALGDLVLAENVSAPELLAAAETCGVRLTRGTLVSADLPVESAAEKRALATQTGGIAVDMETAAIAAACARAGVPLLAIRAISDRAGEPLPVPFAVWFDLARQKPRVWPLLGFLLRHPARILPFARFVRGLRPARIALACFLADFLKNR